MQIKKLIGLYFGSFNPIHIGHLAIANYLLVNSELSEIWFVISPHNPLKNKQSLAPDYHRLEMVKIAIGDHVLMKASNIEFSLPKPSFTIDTLTYIAEKNSKKNFALIMGADNIQNIQKWKNYETILSNYPIFVYPRSGIHLNPNNYNGNIQIINAPLMEISSSFIRDALKEGKDIRFFLTEKVYEYICDCNLYKQ